MNPISSAVAIFAVICVATIAVTKGALTNLGSVDGVTVSADVDEYSYGEREGSAHACRVAGMTIADKVMTSQAVQDLIYDSVASTADSPFYWTSHRDAGAGEMCTVLYNLKGYPQSFLSYRCDEISARTLCEK